MKATNFKKLLCLCLATWLTLCVPASSDAFLTEIIVGGSILAEVGGTVIAALPQLTLFASSVFTLAKTSEEIADTLMSIIKFFVPGKKSDNSKPAPGTQSSGNSDAQPASSSQVTGSSPLQMHISDSENSSDETVDSNSSSPKAKKVNLLVDSLIEKFPFEMALLQQITALEEGDSARSILGDGYGELVSEVSETRQALITIILDGMRSGDGKLIDSFAGRLEILEGQARVALVPVLSKIIEQGAAFNKLYSLPDEGLLASLTDIYAGYLE